MSTSTTRTPFINQNALTYSIPISNSSPRTQIQAFHKSLSEYKATPLISLPTISKSLGINITIKDERQRFNVPSFKPLGISWAIRNAIIAELSENLPSPIPSDIPLSELASKAKEAQIKLITATDGKLGRIVARLGKFFGVESINTRIFVAEGTDEKVVEGIKKEGAEVIEAPGDFEVAVREAWLHSVATDGVLVNIDAEENYEDIPRWIVEGYSTIFQELDEQSTKPIDLLVVPVGVGGLAQATVTHYKTTNKQYRTRILAVEPQTAAALHASLLAGEREEVETSETIMKNLNYGTVSETSWEVLKDGLDASIVVGDREVMDAVSELIEDGVEAGPCGGAVLAGLRSLLDSEKGEDLQLRPDSTIVLVCTDGNDI